MMEIISKFHFHYKANLGELINFYFVLNYQKPCFLMISGGIEVNQFSQIRLILEAKFGDDP